MKKKTVLVEEDGGNGGSRGRGCMGERRRGKGGQYEVSNGRLV